MLNARRWKITYLREGKGLPWWLSSKKKSACKAGNPSLIPGSGRSPGGGHGNSRQYSCLENYMDRAWWATAHGSQRVTTETTEQSIGEVKFLLNPLKISGWDWHKWSNRRKAYSFYLVIFSHAHGSSHKENEEPEEWQGQCANILGSTECGNCGKVTKLFEENRIFFLTKSVCTDFSLPGLLISGDKDVAFLLIGGGCLSHRNLVSSPVSGRQGKCICCFFKCL